MDSASLAIGARLFAEVRTWHGSKKRGDGYHLGFRFGDHKFKKSLKTSDQRCANWAWARVELIEQGEFTIPDAVDFATYVLSDGKLPRPATVKPITLREVLTECEAALQIDRMEPKSIETIRLQRAAGGPDAALSVWVHKRPCGTA